MIKDYILLKQLSLFKSSHFKNLGIIFFLLLFLLISSGYNLNAQNSEEVIRCITVENEQSRLDSKYEEYFERFEEYISQQRANLGAENVNTIYTIPVVFHVIHDNDAVGTGDNIATQYINAQLDQLNNDFRKIMGTSGDGGGVDTRIEFCAALVDENDNMLFEPGINRIDRNNESWTAPPYGNQGFFCLNPSFDYVNNTIKPQSQWDPEQYMNIWVLDMVCGVLGYAQFPEAASLPGIGTGNGPANSDGVVVLPSSVGSTDIPQPGGAPFNEGRTLTHEVGHFFGLRHIWGDGNCSVDDFCADTPTASSSTSGCPAGKDSCPGGGVDQIENYMDYSDDDCMERFTQDQTDRMLIVMGETGMGSPRREILASSTVCSVGEVCEDDLTISGMIESDTYSANLTISSDGIVKEDSVVVFEAGQMIILDEDFIAENGSTFTARIQACTSSTTNEAVVEDRAEVIVEIVETELNIFPNPLSDQTTVELLLQQESEVGIQLYDITGKQVMVVLPVSKQISGKQQYRINASSLETGIYVLRVQIGSEIQTRKLSILK